MVSAKSKNIKLYNSFKVQQRKLRRKNAKLHKQECPFKPTLVTDNKLKRGKNVYTLLYEKRISEKEKEEERKRKQEEEDKKNCTFHPKTTNTGRFETSDGGDRFEELYKESFKINKKKRELLIAKMAEVTFTPEINRKSEKLASNTSSPRKSVAKPPVKSYEEKMIDECTFHPQINRKAKVEAEGEEEVKDSQQTFEKLYQQAVEHNKKVNKNHENAKKGETRKKYSFKPTLYSNEYYKKIAQKKKDNLRNSQEAVDGTNEEVEEPVIYEEAPENQEEVVVEV